MSNSKTVEQIDHCFSFDLDKRSKMLYNEYTKCSKVNVLNKEKYVTATSHPSSSTLSRVLSRMGGWKFFDFDV
jgi:hypothetical protein